MTPEEKAEQYARQEVSEFESRRQHDIVERAFLAGHAIRNEEVKRLREAIQDASVAGKIQQLDEWIEFLTLAIRTERGMPLSERGEGAQDCRIDFISMLKAEKKKLFGPVLPNARAALASQGEEE